MRRLDFVQRCIRADAEYIVMCGSHLRELLQVNWLASSCCLALPCRALVDLRGWSDRSSTTNGQSIPRPPNLTDATRADVFLLGVCICLSQASCHWSYQVLHSLPRLLPSNQTKQIMNSFASFVSALFLLLAVSNTCSAFAPSSSFTGGRQANAVVRSTRQSSSTNLSMIFGPKDDGSPGDYVCLGKSSNAMV